MDAAVRSCVFGSDGALLPTSETAGSGGSREQPPLRQAVVLVFCVVGLLGSYLSWGVLQEKIMTKVRWLNRPALRARNEPRKSPNKQTDCAGGL